MAGPRRIADYEHYVRRTPPTSPTVSLITSGCPLDPASR
jgi:hypothetical protein